MVDMPAVANDMAARRPDILHQPVMAGAHRDRARVSG